MSTKVERITIKVSLFSWPTNLIWPQQSRISLIESETLASILVHWLNLSSTIWTELNSIEFKINFNVNRIKLLANKQKFLLLAYYKRIVMATLWRIDSTDRKFVSRPTVRIGAAQLVRICCSSIGPIRWGQRYCFGGRKVLWSASLTGGKYQFHREKFPKAYLSTDNRTAAFTWGSRLLTSSRGWWLIL